MQKAWLLLGLGLPALGQAQSGAPRVDVIPHAADRRVDVLVDGKPFTAYIYPTRSEEHTSELQSQSNLVCRLLLEKKKNERKTIAATYPTPSMSARRWPSASSAIVLLGNTLKTLYARHPNDIVCRTISVVVQLQGV